MVARPVVSGLVVGSSPAGGAKRGYARVTGGAETTPRSCGSRTERGVGQWLGHLLWEQGNGGSSPLTLTQHKSGDPATTRIIQDGDPNTHG